MRLGGRLAAAIEILDDMERRHRPAAEALKDWGLSHRFAGAGDRGAIGNIVYDALRKRRSAGWLLGSDTPRALAFGALVLEWGETAASLDAALEGDRFAPEPLGAEERSALAAAAATPMPDDIRADAPDWCRPLLESSFGGDWVDEAAALAARPSLDLRVNTLMSDRATVLAEIEETGAAPTRLAPNGIRIPPIDKAGRHPNVQAEPAFQKGWFEIQDEGSQLVAALAAPGPDAQVLDYCAGGGGKTLALSADMGNRGQVYAFDSDKARLAPIFERLRRAGSRNVQVLSKQRELDALQANMDLVLVDAPCTGSGTWRRRPDAKWRLTERQLDARSAEQRAILDAASVHVRPGGRLAYITCSVFDQENGAQVAGFLSRNPDFGLADMMDVAWRVPGLAEACRLDPRRGIVLSPAKTGTDGFFFALLERRVG